MWVGRRSPSVRCWSPLSYAVGACNPFMSAARPRWGDNSHRVASGYCLLLWNHNSAISSSAKKRSRFTSGGPQPGKQTRHASVAILGSFIGNKTSSDQSEHHAKEQEGQPCEDKVLGRYACPSRLPVFRWYSDYCKTLGRLQDVKQAC